MSTRATYSITVTPETGPQYTHHLYIHYDGYLAGAAAYFHHALCHENQRGGLTESLLRSCEYAEFTPDPELHGDTEFHYDITQQNGNVTVTAWEITRDWATDKDTRRRVFHGEIHAFINAHADHCGDDFTPWQLAKVHPYTGPQWICLHRAQRDLAARHSPLSSLKAWINTRHQNSANWQGCVDHLRAYVAAIPQLFTKQPELQQFLTA